MKGISQQCHKLRPSSKKEHIVFGGLPTFLPENIYREKHTIRAPVIERTDIVSAVSPRSPLLVSTKNQLSCLKEEMNQLLNKQDQISTETTRSSIKENDSNALRQGQTRGYLQFRTENHHNLEGNRSNPDSRVQHQSRENGTRLKDINTNRTFEQQSQRNEFSFDKPLPQSSSAGEIQAKLMEQNSRIQQELNIEKSLLSSTTFQLHGCQEKIIRLQKQIAENDNFKISYQSRILKLESECNEKGSRIKFLESNEQNSANLERTLNGKESELRQMRTRAKTFEFEMSKLQEKLSQKQQRCLMFSSGLNSKAEQVSNLKQQKGKLEDQLAVFALQIKESKRISTEATQSWENKLDKANSSISELTESLKASSSVKLQESPTSTQDEAELAVINQEIIILEIELKERERIIKSLRKEIGHIGSDLCFMDGLKNQVHSLIDLNEVLNAKIMISEMEKISRKYRNV